MKADLTEVDVTTNIAQTTCASSRRPFKLLQNFQHCQSFVRARMALSSSALKSITNRPKKVDSSTSQLKELAQARPRTSSISSRQKNLLNSRNSTKCNGVAQKQNVAVGSKIKSTEKDSNTNSVGSLTSSPKWSHIKNKFENGPTVEKNKLERTTSLPKEEVIGLKQTNSKSLNSLVPEITLSVNKIKCSEVKKNTDTTSTKTHGALTTTKCSIEKRKTDNISTKNLNVKDKYKSRCSSPKSSHFNIPVVNTSSLHTSYSKSSRINNSTNKMPLQASNLSKSSHSRNSLTNSSVSLSSNSSKNSEVGVISVKKCDIVSSVLPKQSKLDVLSSDTTLSNSNNCIKSSSSNIVTNCTNSKLNTRTENNSDINSSVSSKKISTSYKPSLYRVKQRHEDKPISNFNNQLGEFSNSAKLIRNKQVRKSFISEENKTLHNSVSTTDKDLKNTVPSNKQINDPSKGEVVTNEAEEAAIIQDLIKSSSSSSKTVWIKNNAGNWTKKNESENTISQSKVASLRSKFLGPNKEISTPITKSVTTSNVPSNSSQFSRPLAKSNTTSSICDKTLIGEISDANSKLSETKLLNSQVNNSNSPKEPGVLPVTRNSLDGDKSLNIVQRAILSFEGNLALLSPESQRRLKLVNEKVQAQTDDNKILKARKSEISKVSVSTEAKEVINNAKPQNIPKVSNSKCVGEPLLPTRSFLTRYQLTNRQTSKEPKAGLKSFLKDSKTKTDTEHIRNSSINNLSGICKTLVAEKDKSTVAHNKTNTVAASPSIESAIVTDKIPMTVNPDISTKTNIKLNSRDSSLQPNPSFLWCHSRAPPSDLSKSSATSSVSLTSSDYKNYYDVQNYYSTLDLEIEKGSDISEEPLYIDSQESTSSDNNYAPVSCYSYQNIPPSTRAKDKKSNFPDEWTDGSDDDFVKSSFSTNQSSTLKKRKSKRYPSQKENHQNIQKASDLKRHHVTDTISFTDSSDTLINDEVENESTYDLADSNHFYEPVYESLGNYLRDTDDQNDNCSISLSPDDRDDADFMQCSITSLESAESTKLDKDEVDTKIINQKKTSNKISQIKRHLSWTKNDIRLELSSKSNKIKIKKNGQNSTEIGVKVQEHSSANTSPKKKTFIKCILRQKSASSIPIKRSPSPKKESALFYVHLTMGREKQRPFSDSVVSDESSKNFDQDTLKFRKQSEPSLQQQLTSKDFPQRPRFRKVSCTPRLQRPKTPPPLPPILQNKKSTTESTSTLLNGKDDDTSPIGFIDDIPSLESPFYTCLDSDILQNESEKVCHSEESTFQSLQSDVSRVLHTSRGNGVDHIFNTPPRSRKYLSNLKFSDPSNFLIENLKSPFEEEPMYQFYQRDVQQRATLGYSADVSESEFEDDASSKFSDSEYSIPSRPVLQSQLSAMDLVHGEGGQRTLWCEVPEVIECGILKTIPSSDRKIQEAMFEVITSEASYLKSLNFLIEHFVQCPEFSGSQVNVLDKRERHVLFSDIQPVKEVSARLLADLEKRWLENIVLSNICDIVYHHASKYFSVYVKYCSNQIYQERTLKELKERKSEFITVLKRLESSSICQGLDMHSFLMLPMQRITRLPLLIDAIYHRLPLESPIYGSCKMALGTVNKLVAECNEGARKMGRMEEMLVISQQLDFKDCKGLGVLSASRWLVKKGELVQLMLDSSARRTFGRSTRWCKIQLYLFLFTDLLVVTRKKSDESYSVVDFCPRNMLEVLNLDENLAPLPMRLPSGYRNIFRLTLLHNKEGKEAEMFLSCLLESDRTRWMDALTPTKSENPDEKIYEKWECKQVQCIHVYNAQQPDELSLEEADVVNVVRKITGWFEGERIRDGVRGWFPCSHVREIVNSHVIARNVRQRYRLLVLSRQYLEEQYKAQATHSKK